MHSSIEAKVHSLGEPYADGTPNLEIEIPVENVTGKSFVTSLGVPITLRIAGESYDGKTLANDPKHKLVWISPTLIASDGKRTTLGRVLTAAGFKSADKIRLLEANQSLEVLHG